MPRTKTSQKQKQKQVVSQKVIVNIPESKPKRTRRKRKPKQEPSEYARGIQPNLVAYQSYVIPQPPPSTPNEPETFRKTGVVDKKATIVPEDIGQVGTEGRVEIITKPEKSEQMADLLSLVPPQFTFTYDEQQLTGIPREPQATPFSYSDIDEQSRLFQSTLSRQSSAESVGGSVISGGEISQESITKKASTPRRKPEDIRQALIKEYKGLSNEVDLPDENMSNNDLRKMIKILKAEKKSKQKRGSVMGF